MFYVSGSSRSRLRGSRQRLRKNCLFAKAGLFFACKWTTKPLRKTFPVLCKAVVNLKKDSPMAVERQSCPGSVYVQCATLYQQPDFHPLTRVFSVSSLPTPPLPLFHSCLFEYISVAKQILLVQCRLARRHRSHLIFIPIHLVSPPLFSPIRACGPSPTNSISHMPPTESLRH